MKNLLSFGLVVLCTLFLVACDKEEPIDSLQGDIKIENRTEDVSGTNAIRAWAGTISDACNDQTVSLNVLASTPEECDCQLIKWLQDCSSECCYVETQCHIVYTQHTPLHINCP